ncbi:hypothetical protein [Burkholderia plantarii]|uniref:hypothetical protein n=1 Tax=Burkholderia plantarii TaxID=41899 RepID=UPI00114CC7F7|nr:hypothetical protein [Burkholderia plantarii]
MRQLDGSIEPIRLLSKRFARAPAPIGPRAPVVRYRHTALTRRGAVLSCNGPQHSTRSAGTDQARQGRRAATLFLVFLQKPFTRAGGNEAVEKWIWRILDFVSAPCFSTIQLIYPTTYHPAMPINNK